MNFVNRLIENYDLDELECLNDEEVKILMTEISIGLEFLSFEKICKKSCDFINPTNLSLLYCYNLGSETNNRNISTE